MEHLESYENFDQIEQSIQKTLREYVQKVKYEKSNKTWTNELLNALGKLGGEFGYKPCPSVTESAWLYDMVWYREQVGVGVKKIPFLVEVPFAMESEWNPEFEEIKYDFEKLLVVNATHRLMICYAKPDDYFMLLNFFYDSIQNY